MASSHVVRGTSSSIFDRLSDPLVMGAIWQGAFSCKALAYADRVASRPELNIAGKKSAELKDILSLDNEAPDARAFAEDLKLVKRLFGQLGLRLTGKQNIFDISRVEPAQADQYTKDAGPWHSDSRGGLIGLAVPSGVTTEYLPTPNQGSVRRGLFFYAGKQRSRRAAHAIFGSFRFCRTEGG